MSSLLAEEKRMLLHTHISTFTTCHAHVVVLNDMPTCLHALLSVLHSFIHLFISMKIRKILLWKRLIVYKICLEEKHSLDSLNRKTQHSAYEHKEACILACQVLLPIHVESSSSCTSFQVYIVVFNVRWEIGILNYVLQLGWETENCTVSITDLPS